MNRWTNAKRVIFRLWQLFQKINSFREVLLKLPKYLWYENKLNVIFKLKMVSGNSNRYRIHLKDSEETDPRGFS